MDHPTRAKPKVLLQKEWTSQKILFFAPRTNKDKKKQLRGPPNASGVLRSLFPFPGCFPSFSVASPHLSTSLLQRGKVSKHRNLTSRRISVCLAEPQRERFWCEAGFTRGLICFPGTPMIDMDEEVWCLKIICHPLTPVSIEFLCPRIYVSPGRLRRPTLWSLNLESQTSHCTNVY